jgi:hypothetical protein
MVGQICPPAVSVVIPPLGRASLSATREGGLSQVDRVRSCCNAQVWLPGHV